MDQIAQLGDDVQHMDGGGGPPPSLLHRRVGVRISEGRAASGFRPLTSFALFSPWLSAPTSQAVLQSRAAPADAYPFAGSGSIPIIPDVLAGNELPDVKDPLAFTESCLVRGVGAAVMGGFFGLFLGAFLSGYGNLAPYDPALKDWQQIQAQQAAKVAAETAAKGGAAAAPATAATAAGATAAATGGVAGVAQPFAPVHLPELPSALNKISDPFGHLAGANSGSGPATASTTVGGGGGGLAGQLHGTPTSMTATARSAATAWRTALQSKLPASFAKFMPGAPAVTSSASSAPPHGPTAPAPHVPHATLTAGPLVGGLSGSLPGGLPHSPISEYGVPEVPLRVAFVQGLKEMKNRGISSGKNFAIVGGVFSTIECFLETYRGKRDMKNAVIAGFSTGAILAARGGVAAALFGGAGFGAFSVVIELASPYMFNHD